MVGCALLVGAGCAKAVRPEDTARALAAVLPVGPGRLRTLVRVGAVTEACLGAAALVVPRPASAWSVAVSYAAFTVAIVAARSRRWAIASCGCFGTPDTPATGLHAAVTAGLTGAAVAVARSHPSGTLGDVLSRQPGHGAPLVAASALATWLAYLAIARFGELQAARQGTAVSFDRPGRSDIMTRSGP